MLRRSLPPSRGLPPRRSTQRVRPSRRVAGDWLLRNEHLEERVLLSAPNELTALYQNGFGPTSLHFNGSASLAGTRLRLTDGGPNEESTAFYTTPLYISKDFTTTFQFQFAASGTSPLGEGLAFVI